ncbi:hypothetical protein [Cephaloticoccus primus]|nr:hypothetical protein [Cephaloticoccus primus]
MLPESPELQTVLALLVVAAAAAWLLWRVFSKSGGGGCASGECASLSPDVKALQRRLKRRGS